MTIVKALLAHGANPNARLQQEKPTVRRPSNERLTFEGATPLALAAEVNNLEASRRWWMPAPIRTFRPSKGTTPLILAAGAGTDVQRARALEERAMAVETAKFLVEHGADVNAAGQFGWTALHAAPIRD